MKHRGRPRLFLVRFLFLLLLSTLKKTKQVSISFTIVKTLRVESNEIKYTKLQKALFQRKGLIVLAFVASNDDCDMHKGPVIIFIARGLAHFLRQPFSRSRSDLRFSSAYLKLT